MTTPKVATFLVGWITALHHELAAARCLLDEEFEEGPEDFSPPATDTNTYTWGRIGKHNVVVTSLPEGVYDPTSTTEVASRLSASLPHLRFGLLVGIGAGITAGGDGIRLGDVVVSKPTGTLGGLVQYDSLKAKVRKRERYDERIGFLAKPPTVLLTALTKWGSTFEMDGSRIPALLSKAFESRPRMRKTFGYPGAAKDPLRADMVMAGDDERYNSPEIHLGIIASGHKLIKAAEERDRIVEWLGGEDIQPLCLEMEAAGLMDCFPCLVVRGICDYADERKNDDWQRYAALTAACFAKELLLHVDAVKVGKEDTLAQRLESIGGDIRQVKEDTTFLTEHTRTREFDDLLDWISTEDYSSRLHDEKRRHQPGTAQWFLDHPKYQAWAHNRDSWSSESPTLFCHGHQGSGKTIMSALAIQDLLDHLQPRQAVMYLFFNHKQQGLQTPEHVMSVILRQALYARRTASKAAAQMREKHIGKNTRPGLQEIEQALKESLADIQVAYIVLDALDECRTDSARTVVGKLKAIMREGSVQLLVTARRIPETEALFPDDERIRISAIPDDLAVYASERADTEFQQYLSREADLVQRVVDRVVEVSAGTFLLARLIMDNLAEQDTIADMEESLESVPYGENGLRHLHEKALGRLLCQPDKHIRRALEALTWVVYGRRLLQCKELEHALAFSVEDTTLDPRRVPPIAAVVSQCAGLLTIDEQSGLVRVVHETTQQYLEEALGKLAPCHPDFRLACKCITYATIDDLATIEVEYRDIETEIIPRYPLYTYATDSWIIHAKKVEQEGTSEEFDVFLCIFERIKSASLAMNCVVEGTWEREHSVGTPNEVTIWHALAIGNLVRTCQALLETTAYSDAGDYAGRTPLHWAASEGSIEVATLLLESSLDNATYCDELNQTPLWYAADYGKVEMVELLLEAGSVGEQMQKSVKGTPLQAAVCAGHEAVVRVLLNLVTPNSAIISSTEEQSSSDAAIVGSQMFPTQRSQTLTTADLGLDDAIREAAECGHELILERLLATGKADLNSADEETGETALHKAACNGEDSIVRLLLEQEKVEVNRSNRNKSVPLHRALYRVLPYCEAPHRRFGHFERIIRMLSAVENVKVDVRDIFAESPLSLAARSGRNDCLQMIVMALDESSEEYKQALEYAYVINTLLEKTMKLSGLDWPAFEFTKIERMKSMPAIPQRKQRLDGLSNADALALYVYMTDCVVCRSCGRMDLHQGYHCSTCVDKNDWINQVRCAPPPNFDNDLEMPFKELFHATNLCRDCASYDCLDESVAIYLWGRERSSSSQRPVISPQDCGHHLGHTFLWVDAQPLLEYRFDVFVAPYKVYAIERSQNISEAMVWKFRLRKRDESERHKMDDMCMPNPWHPSWKFRRCEYLRCDIEHSKHSAWCRDFWKRARRCDTCNREKGEHDRYCPENPDDMDGYRSDDEDRRNWRKKASLWQECVNLRCDPSERHSAWCCKVVEGSKFSERSLIDPGRTR